MTTAGEWPTDGAVDRLAATVRAVPGVGDLHGGAFGGIGTYLPGRMVPGIRVSADTVDIHISVVADAPIRATAAAVRRAVAAEFPGTPVDVTVEDIYR